MTTLAGFAGAGLAGAAYLPQIWHLLREHCSAGISRAAYAAWLVASVLVTIHAAAVAAPVFLALGGVQIAATALVLALATRYLHSSCAGHSGGRGTR